MFGSYRIGIEVGHHAQALTAQVARVRDRVWLALLDLDEAMERRIEVLEARLAEVRQGIDDYSRARGDE
ncbi:MAG: hypothetical protein ACRD2H_13850 [Terriglobales bacterium]